MDLYIQVGLLLVISTGFVLLAYIYSQVLDVGKETYRVTDNYKVSYSSDDAYNNPTILIDGRNLAQWVRQKSMSRDVYLMYYNGAGQPIAGLTPPNNISEFNTPIEVEVSGAEYFLREMTLHDKFQNKIPTAIRYKDVTNVKKYLNTYVAKVDQIATKKMATVYTFPAEEDGRVIYVVTIQ